MNKKKIYSLIALICIFIMTILYVILKDNSISYEPNYNVDKYIKYTYQDNEYKIISIEQMDIINKYYNEYLNLILNDQKKLYDLISDSQKEKYDTFSKFKKYCNKFITTKTKKNKVEKYNINKQKDYNVIKIIDSEDRTITIYEYGVNVYKLEIKF